MLWRGRFGCDGSRQALRVYVAGLARLWLRARPAPRGRDARVPALRRGAAGGRRVLPQLPRAAVGLPAVPAAHRGRHRLQQALGVHLPPGRLLRGATRRATRALCHVPRATCRTHRATRRTPHATRHARRTTRVVPHVARHARRTTRHLYLRARAVFPRHDHHGWAIATPKHAARTRRPTRG
eukprot:6636856-Prymnesium_polylepis.1